jgi:hypothetical protein
MTTASPNDSTAQIDGSGWEAWMQRHQDAIGPGDGGGAAAGGMVKDER